MRRIVKSASPSEFENWKAANPQKNFRDFGNNPGDLVVKSQLKKSLFDEQFGLCAYCCASIKIEASHIEHIIPHCSRIGQMDYNNLVCSCNGFQIARNTCGHKKDNEYIAVSPLDKNCETRFKYTTFGKILPADPNDEGADNTIKTLNLNSYELVTARREMISLLLHSVDKSNKETEKKKYSTPQNGKLEAFLPTIIYTIDNYI